MSKFKAIKAIKQFCLECQGDAKAMRECQDKTCPLWQIRLYGTNDYDKELIINPLRAIRKQCLICADNRKNVRSCDARTVCTLWSYRFGVLPETYKRIKKRLSQNKVLFLIK